MTRMRIIAMMAAAVLAVAGCDSSPNSGPPAQTPEAASPTSEPPTAAAAAPSSNSGYADIVNEVSPSVVTIQTDGGIGSGVVLRPNVVTTNAHVVADQPRVTVVFADGQRSPGEVLAVDTITDLAVVRTERGNLPVPEYREDLPLPGEVALAIGSPLGFENSVTVGVISGLHRDIPGSAGSTASLVDLIQTDASISPGNSGGALLDAQGRVVGINEAYIPPAAGAVALGFAIPTSTVLDVTEQLLTTGSVDHPYLGVSLRPLTDQLRRQLGIDAESGAVILDIDRTGPAGQVGVRPGDIITGLAGQPVRSVEDVLTIVRQTDPGQQIPLTVNRQGEQQQFSVTVGTRST